jgi:hypothetical protein
MPDTPPPPESDPQIKQDVTGDRNQSIGQAIDWLRLCSFRVMDRSLI